MCTHIHTHTHTNKGIKDSLTFILCPEQEGAVVGDHLKLELSHTHDFCDGSCCNHPLGVHLLHPQTRTRTHKDTLASAHTFSAVLLRTLSSRLPVAGRLQLFSSFLSLSLCLCLCLCSLPLSAPLSNNCSI